MLASQTPRLHFLRFEFKYVLSRADRDAVEAELRHFLELDPYVASRPDHQYLVRSLYFDDRQFSCYREKCDGVHTRSKFRIRTYGCDPAAETPWFLEIKGRHNNLVFKHRTPFAGEYDRRAAGEALGGVAVRHAAPGRVRDEFEFQLYRRQLQPVVLVDYLRRPYVSRFDPDFRLTFDSQLTAARATALFPRQANLRALLPGYTVMEVKFRHLVPSWFHRILQAYELRRRSISKICTGMEALGVQIDPELNLAFALSHLPMLADLAALIPLLQGPQQTGPVVTAPRTWDYLTNLGVATGLGLVLALAYRYTHKGLSYSQAFTQTILLVALIVAIVMMTIDDNLARAFGLVGALSIIRFRTVVKDTRDTTFVFAALALGMAAGTKKHELAAIGTAFFVVLVLVLYATNFGSLYKSEFILRFTFDQDRDSGAYLAKLQEFARRSHMLHIEPSGDGKSLRLTYDITLDKNATAEKLTAALGQVPGVSDVVLIVSKNDIDY